MNASPLQGIPIVDSHIHLWDLEIYKRRDWLQDKPRLVRDYLPAHAAGEFSDAGVAEGIIVEANKYSRSDNEAWLSMAAQNEFLDGVVAGAYLDDPDLAEQLDSYETIGPLKGVRASPRYRSDDWHEPADYLPGIRELARRNLVLDILVGYDSLETIAALVDRSDDLRVVVNHCGLPKNNPIARKEWTKQIESLSKREMVYMKYSGHAMITEGGDDRDFVLFIADTLLDAFDPERMLWGSNWPVDSLWMTYRDDLLLSLDGLPSLSEDELTAIYSGTARSVYSLPVR